MEILAFYLKNVKRHDISHLSTFSSKFITPVTLLLIDPLQYVFQSVYKSAITKFLFALMTNYSQIIDEPFAEIAMFCENNRIILRQNKSTLINFTSIG
jgi:hypothetical protein